MRSSIPAIDGVAASHLQLPPGTSATALDALCAQFPAIGRDTWIDRFARGRVLDGAGAALGVDAPFRAGMDVYYFREVATEQRIPFEETVLHADADLVVADKPHFLPVTPAGGFVNETLLARLVRRLGNPSLVPLHRIDRGTAGLVLFSANPATRTRYQALFRERAIIKRYEAWAPALPGLEFPLVRRSRLVAGEPFFRMREFSGEPNSESRVEVMERAGDWWRYRLEPVSGRKHQLRVHMSALGAPIRNDPFYPALADAAEDDHRRPLQLLARTLEFMDPLSGENRRFDSGLQLMSVRKDGSPSTN